jgi:hypothetical protein
MRTQVDINQKKKKNKTEQLTKIRLRPYAKRTDSYE